MKAEFSSFRDPSGRVFLEEGHIIRSIQEMYAPHWEAFNHSGLRESLLAEGLIVDHEEMEPPFPVHAWKCLRVEKVPFISYPYEWSFQQLKDAALLTLKIQKEALKQGMSLKDASAYNVQFHRGRAIFIDLLSFELQPENSPWQAYRQFCMHFLAPLALYAYDSRFSRTSSQWIDGVPLDWAWKMLGRRKLVSLGLQMHLHLHSLAELKYADGRQAAKKVAKNSISTQGLLDVVDSLIRTVKALRAPHKQGDWTEYYEDTNYSHEAEEKKRTLVTEWACAVPGSMAVDLGANTGVYSEILASTYETVLAVDLDPGAVDIFYRKLKKQSASHTILPLVQDLSNPSPGIGWLCQERNSWVYRVKADCVMALALTHHLYFTNGIPWDKQAEFFAAQLNFGGKLIVEFVASEDSQVQRMLAARDNVFVDYDLESFKAAFGQYFDLESQEQVGDAARTLLLLKRKECVLALSL